MDKDKQAKFLKMLASRDQEAIYESFQRHSRELRGFATDKPQHTPEEILSQLDAAHAESTAAQNRVEALLSAYTATQYDPDDPFKHLLAYLTARAQIQGDWYELDEGDYTINYIYNKVAPPTLHSGSLLIGHENERCAVRVTLNYVEGEPPEMWEYVVDKPFIVPADAGVGPHHVTKENIYKLFERWALNQI